MFLFLPTLLLRREVDKDFLNSIKEFKQIIINKRSQSEFLVEETKETVVSSEASFRNGSTSSGRHRRALRLVRSRRVPDGFALGWNSNR